MVWKDLLRVAVIGVDRAKLNEETAQFLIEKKIINPKSEAGEQLLTAVAAWNKLRKAGCQFTSFTREIPPAAPAESKATAYVVAPFLEQILNEEYPAALKECLGLLIQKKQLVPPQFLVGLIEKTSGKPELYKLLQLCGGERLKWLEKLVYGKDPSTLEKKHFEKAFSIQRHQIFNQKREVHPEEALDWLKDCWKTESKTEKCFFLNALKENLSSKDESFINSCLNDASKEVRFIAAGLLAQLPDSEWLNEMRQNFKEWVEVRETSGGKIKLKLALPENVGEVLSGKGIDPGRNLSVKSMKVNSFAKAASCMPPNWWNSTFNLSAQDFLPLFVRHEHGDTLLQAMIDASCLHKDVAWQIVLVEFWLENYQKARWQHLSYSDLLKQLPRSVLWKTAPNALMKIKFIEDDKEPIARLLLAKGHLWNKELSTAFFGHFLNWLRLHGHSSWQGWVYKRIIDRASYTCHLELFSILENEWPFTFSGPWDVLRTSFFSKLRFRIDLHKTISTD